MKSSLLILIGVFVLAIAVPVLAGDVASLDKAVTAWAKEATAPTYKYAFVDLNDDGAEDAVVLMLGNYCGSGGCTLVIFRGVAGRFERLSASTITNEPILLLPEKHKGWHTLSVRVAGGGGKPGQVIMRFNGTRYPGNPSLQRKAGEQELKGAKKLNLLFRSTEN